jgi:hypothetical protein
MKALKLGIFALAIGFFAASCSGTNSTDDTTSQDQVETTTPDQTMAPADSSAMDTTVPATDTATPAPAAE